MKAKVRLAVYALAFGLLTGAANMSAAQQVKASLFHETDAALKAAQTANAQLLAPKSYNRAMKHYDSAKAKFERGKNLDAIRGELAQATQYFRQATAASEKASKELRSLIKTRHDAAKVKASRYAPDSWKRAEENLSKAMIELERGANEPAKLRAQEADKYYREAELTAIKATYLSEAQLLIARAEKAKVDRYAPRTLAKAKSLLQRAEKELIQNRYDTDLPRSLAQDAKYEAKHAMQLAKTIQNARAQKLTTEQLILEWERPIAQIAATADMRAEFDQGYQDPTNQIIAYIDDQQVQLQRLNQDINDLHGEVTLMRGQLGGATQERIVLSERLETQARVREQFAKVENIFARDEARVLRESNDVIIRLVGLSFAVGQANIEPENFRLLTKVQSAIQAFPNSKLIIQGHTDSHGSDTANYALSQRRAEAVKAYMMANMRINPSAVAAIGYGETKPIANNETPEGRAKNRRIDIVIRTQGG